VFFDPIGQALCKHTVDIVEEMNKQCGTKHTQKLKFFLSKADAAGSSVERQKVVGQIIRAYSWHAGTCVTVQAT